MCACASASASACVSACASACVSGYVCVVVVVYQRERERENPNQIKSVGGSAVISFSISKWPPPIDKFSLKNLSKTRYAAKQQLGLITNCRCNGFSYSGIFMSLQPKK